MKGARGFLVLLSLIPAISVAKWQHSLRSHSISGATTAPNAWSEMMDSTNRMHLAMSSVAPSGNDDADFVKLMLPHHQAAIDMAKAELLHGNDPKMRRLAQEIVTDQESEIQLMQLWMDRQAKDRPFPDPQKEQ